MIKPKNQEFFYNKNFSKNIIFSERQKKIVSLIKNKHFDRILDLGCGDGSFTVHFKKFSKDVYGVDISKKAVLIANKKGIRAKKINIDKQNLSFKNNFFDAVFCGEVIEHLYDTDHLLKEIYRVLKKDGILIITTPNLHSWLSRLTFLFGFQPYLSEVSLFHNVGKLKGSDDISGHIRCFGSKALSELLILNKFYIIKKLGVSIHSSLPTFLSFVDRVISNNHSLAQLLIFICKK